LVFRAYDTKRSFNDQGRLMLVQRSSGRMRPLAPTFDRQAAHVAWAPDSKSLLFTAEDRGRVGLWRLAVASDGADASPQAVVAGGTISGFAQSRDGSVIAFERGAVVHPPALFACRSDGSAEHPIDDLNRSLLRKHALGAVREVTVKGWGGVPVQ